MTIHAAIYARKSTDQMVADEAKSVTRQVENARAFAIDKGWTVADAHVFVDDGISGAEFANRPGLQRLLALLPRPPFTRLIVSEQKSIGREMSETGWIIKQLAEAGVEIFEYRTWQVADATASARQNPLKRSRLCRRGASRGIQRARTRGAHSAAQIGNGSCPNALRIRVSEMNEAVLQAIEEHALTPEAIERVLQLTERDDVRNQQDRLVHERKDIEKRLARLVAAIESGGDAASLVAKLRQLETRKAAIDTEMVSLRPFPRLAPAVIENRLAEWRRLLRASTTQGRTVIQRIVQGRITFTPRRNRASYEVDGYDFEATTHFGKLFQGLAAEPRRAWSGHQRDARGLARRTRARATPS